MCTINLITLPSTLSYLPPTLLHPFLRFLIFGFAFRLILFNQGHLCDHWIRTIH